MDRWTDERVDRLIGHLLRAGVLISAVVVLAGGCLYLIRHGMDAQDHRPFHGEPARFSDPRQIAQAALAGEGRGTIAFGLLLLIATPVARVALACYGFLREHDHLYTAVAAFVLVVLMFSFVAP